VTPAVPLVRPSPLFGAIVAATVAAGVGLALQADLTEGRVVLFAFVVGGWVASLCLHEFAHAVAAYVGGDRAVVDKGYLTLDPRRYTEPLLSIGMPLLFLVAGGIGLPGGAVWIERHRIRSRASLSAVSLAGPATNLAAGFVLLAPFRLVPDALAARPSLLVGLAFLAFLQFLAATLNLLPVPGLDGFGALEPWLGRGVQQAAAQVRPYAFLLVFIAVWQLPQAWAALTAPARVAMDFFDVPPAAMPIGATLFRFWER
jgi:Zn-dependent protease